MTLLQMCLGDGDLEWRPGIGSSLLVSYLSLPPALLSLFLLLSPITPPANLSHSPSLPLSLSLAFPTPSVSPFSYVFLCLPLSPLTPTPCSCSRASILGGRARDLEAAHRMAHAGLRGHIRARAPAPPCARGAWGPGCACALLGWRPALREAEAAGLHGLQLPAPRASSFHPVICEGRGEGIDLGPDPSSSALHPDTTRTVVGCREVAVLLSDLRLSCTRLALFHPAGCQWQLSFCLGKPVQEQAFTPWLTFCLCP